MKFFLVSLSLDRKRYSELEKFSGISYVRESEDAITYHNFHHKSLGRYENKIDKDLNS